MDSLATNPDAALTGVTQTCACRALVTPVIVLLGSRADRELDTGLESIWERLKSVARESLNINIAQKARLRMQRAQISTLYAGQSLMLAGRCPVCRAEIVATLTPQ